MDIEIDQGGELNGRLQAPGDKSITHRAFLLGAIAEGETRIVNISKSLDCRATFDALRALAGDRELFDYREENLEASIFEAADSGAFARLSGSDSTLNLGNSGTGMRLLCGLLAAAPFDSVIDGDASLRRRPMARIIEPLRLMGADIKGEAGGRAPLRIKGGRRLNGMRHAMSVASAQLKSCLMLAGLLAESESVISEPAPSRDHTERLLRHLGLALPESDGQLRVPPLYAQGGCLRGAEIKVAGDISSAMFALVGAAIGDTSQLVITDVGVNPGRIGGIDILRRMGADIEISNHREWSGEPVADIELRGGAQLKGVDIEAREVPAAIDEFPALFIAAACAEGSTRLRGAAELRVKESDRLATMAAGLAALGVSCELNADGIRIEGGRIEGGVVDSAGDHRVAMAFAMAGVRATGAIRIRDCDNIRTSWPDFISSMRELGLRLEQS